MEHSTTIAEFAKSLAKAQGDFKDAERDRDNPFFHSTYSTMAAVLTACRKALSENGISVLQATEDADGDSLRVETMLMHTSGEWFKTTLKVRVLAMKVEKGDRDAGVAAVKAITPQAMGSASTYACRIALRSLIVVASEAAEDDDGNAASDNKPAEGKFLDVIVDIQSETQPGKPGKKPWTIHRIETGEHGTVSTFNQELADNLKPFKGTGQQVELEAKRNPKGFGFDLVDAWPVQAQSEAQGGTQVQLPPQAKAAEAKAPAAVPAAAVETFQDTVEEVNVKTVADAPPRYGFKTKAHGWVGTGDVYVNTRIAKLKQTGILVEFQASKNGLGGWELVSAQEVPPGEEKPNPAPPAPKAEAAANVAP